MVAAASEGLGKAIAWELAREGARLAICSRNEGRIRAASETIREDTGAEVHPFVCDLTREDEVAAFVSQAAKALGGVDILVTNAGGPPPGHFEDVDDAAWYGTYDLTYLSAVRLIREALPHLKRAGHGRIVVMTSISVKQPIPDLILSNAVRMSVVGMAKSLVPDVGPHGITVNVVCPGYSGRLGPRNSSQPARSGRERLLRPWRRILSGSCPSGARASLARSGRWSLSSRQSGHPT